MATGWEVGELAEASREPPERLRRYAEAGLLQRGPDGRFEADSPHRLRLIQYARERGVTDDQLAAEVERQGDLLDMFDDLAPSRDLHTVVDLVTASHELGIAEDLRQALLEALGVPDARNATEEDLAALRLMGRALRHGLPGEALLQLVRVFADLTHRLADAENRIFHDWVHERFRAHGLAGRELLDATRGVGKPLIELVEPALLYFHRRAWRHANREDLLRHLAEPTTPPSATPGETHTSVMFVDLASFTALTSAMGDHSAADVLRRFAAMVRAAAARHGGHIVKQIGDAFMLTFTQARDAITFGLAMDQLVDAEPLFPPLHIGAHHGVVLHREADLVGGAVNLAARVTSACAPAQFLITEDLHHAAAPDLAADAEYPAEFAAEFVALPARMLKGLPNPTRLVEVRRRAEPTHRETDPVCGMLLHPGDVAARTTHHGTEYAFCSTTCQRAFADKPTNYSPHGRING